MSALPVLALSACAFATAGVLAKWFGAPSAQGRFTTIDGLRGYLAFFVFLHHSCIWYFYLHGHPWELPPSRLYTHLGKGGVGMFFMITGFLFFLKLLEARKQGVDWTKPYVSRVLRLTPLYVTAMLGLFLVIAVLSDATLRVPLSSLIVQLLRWLSFTVSGSRDINGIENSWIIVAGVTWSLRYEWLFYLCLPLLALTLGLRPPTGYLLVAAAVAVAGAVLMWAAPVWLLLPFASGMLAALLTRLPAFCRLARHHAASILVIVCLGCGVGLYPSPERATPLALYSVAFALIACGNSLFGLLTHPFSRTLGEMAYGLYLLHGLALFTTFHFVLGLERSGALSPLQHWLVVGAVVPLLITACFASYQWIELPAMRKVNPMTLWLRRWLKSRPARPAAD